MFLPELSIRRPVLATVMSLVVVLLGLIAYERLTVREYPKIDEPVVTVETTFKGASADIVESQVTQILEESLAGIEGIDYMSSISRPEKSQITATLPARPRPRRRRQRRARPRRAGARPAARRDRRADRLQGRGRRPADPLPGVLVRSPLADGRHRLRRPLRQGPAAEPVGRGRRAHLRRAALFDAHLARPRAARRLPPDAAGRRGRACAGRTSRSRPAASRAQAREFTVVTETDLRTPEQFEEHRAARGRRLSGPARRRRPRRARARERARQRPLQRPQRRGARRGQAGDRQPARRLRGGARRAAGDPAGSARGHAAPISPTTARSSSANRSMRCSRPSPRRSCWWCW